MKKWFKKKIIHHMHAMEDVNVDVDVDADAHTYDHQRKKDKQHLQTGKWRLCCKRNE